MPLSVRPDVIRTMYAWRDALNSPKGPKADDWRAKLAELHACEPDRAPDVILGGPDYDMDERARDRYFGRDIPEIASVYKATLKASE